jgi:transcriptional regulator with XRE-family HTH domain
MKKSKLSPSNRVAQVRKARGLTQQQLADAIGSHWITVSKLERGVMRLSDEWREAIAKALDVDQWSLLLDGRPLPVVHIEGQIDEGGKVIAYEDDDGSENFIINTNYFTHPSFRWLLVAGDALWPWYQDGDRLCLWQLPESEWESVRGRLCLIWYESKSGDDDMTVAIMSGRGRDGLYTLERFGMPPIRSAKITAVAAVAMSVYYLGPDSISEATNIRPRDTAPL